MLRWVRANRSFCGLLALFALSLQLYLSFGHVHAEDLGLSPQAAVVAQSPASSHDGNGSAPQSDDDHDVCAICVALSLTANSVVPVVAPLAQPIATGFAWLHDFIFPRRDFQFAANFRARAPPHA